MASKKKTKVQTAAAIATAGLPAPVQKIATSKAGSMLLVVGAIVLVATGAITVSWKGGKPSVTVNEARAEQLKEEVRERARDVVERIAEERGQAGIR